MKRMLNARHVLQDETRQFLLDKLETHLAKAKQQRCHVKVRNAKKQFTSVDHRKGTNDKDNILAIIILLRHFELSLSASKCVSVMQPPQKWRSGKRQGQRRGTIDMLQSLIHQYCIRTKAVGCQPLWSTVFFGQTAFRGLLSSQR